MPDIELKLADDVSALLKSFNKKTSIDTIKNGLARIVIYIRTEVNYRGRQTESIAEIEQSLIEFLNIYDGENFEEIYAIIREIVRHIPKFKVFDIDITELRNIAHDFDADCRYNPVFASIASDIRNLVHQHLSERVITKIEELENFLRSDKATGLLDGTVVAGATPEKKAEIMNYESYRKLSVLKEKLKLAWSNQNSKGGTSYSRSEFASVIELILRVIDIKEIKSLKSYAATKLYLSESLEKLSATGIENIGIGESRYHLKKLIENIACKRIKKKGETVFRLITTDALLEQISFIYYSNIVNSNMREINDDNYLDSIKLLIELALCSRAVGHGTKHLGRFAFLLQRLLEELKDRPDRIAHVPSIVEAMNSELENNFFYLQELFSNNLSTPDKSSIVTKILNNMIREKTTHLLGNMINSIKTYSEKKQMEKFQNILKLKEKIFSIKDFVFRFGTDADNSGLREEFISPEFMGGKGYSQVMNSMIICDNSLYDLDVPKGAGFSTLTWYNIKDISDRMSDFTAELNSIIRDLESRAGKKFGSESNPLLLMARSGAVASMPGILDTVSHIGINEKIAGEWSVKLKEPGRAYLAYVSFMLSYAKSVLGLNTGNIIKIAGLKNFANLFKHDLNTIHFEAKKILSVIEELSGLGKNAIPTDPFTQIYNSTIAVFKSFERDIVQRQAENYGIPKQFQTACLIQECLPILSPQDSSGVLFTRNPNTGKLGHRFPEQIEFGEGFFGDVIADGTISPSSTEKFIRIHMRHYEILKKFKYYDERLQRHPTDIEFAIRDNKMYIVQSRILKQTPAALIVNSYDFYREGIYSEFKLIKRTAFSLNKRIIEKYLDRKQLNNVPVIARGKPVNGGAVRGRIITNDSNLGLYEDQLIFLTESNVPPRVIMKEKSISGYISKEGGVTSHAALVAIGERKPCVTDVNWRKSESGEIIFGGTKLNEGDFITLDANTGNIYQEEIPIIESPLLDEEFKKIKSSIIKVIDRLVSMKEKE